MSLEGADPRAIPPRPSQGLETAAPVVEVIELSKSYGPVRALDRVTFDVREGQIVGFLGPNGAGKSTTLRILAGFLPGDSGIVRVAGHDVREDSLAVRSEIGYLPEGVPLYPDMRVIEYLRYRARLKGIPRSKRKRQIDASLEAADVTDVRRRIIGTLSRGYRQRIGLADALLSEPKVLILDEPTVGLDPEQVRHFREVLRAVGQERTVFLSTHILQEVEIVCSHVVIIHRGRIAARGSRDELRSVVGSRAKITVEIAGSRSAIERELQRIDGVTRVEVGPSSDDGGGSEGYKPYFVYAAADTDPREEMFRLVAASGWRLRRLEREALPLEDVFLDIVGGEN
ncbi:MAG TPA: ATP-binding cassette domain-containing protein [Planctomycetota bacterium]|nr:ATP-binding cassette domain-containing protein [Planctomycetota bacterium]